VFTNFWKNFVYLFAKSKLVIGQFQPTLIILFIRTCLCFLNGSHSHSKWSVVKRGLLPSFTVCNWCSKLEFQAECCTSMSEQHSLQYMPVLNVSDDLEHCWRYPDSGMWLHVGTYMLLTFQMNFSQHLPDLGWQTYGTWRNFVGMQHSLLFLYCFAQPASLWV
jgi:hypothetical protein